MDTVNGAKCSILKNSANLVHMDNEGESRINSTYRNLSLGNDQIKEQTNFEHLGLKTIGKGEIPQCAPYVESSLEDKRGVRQRYKYITSACVNELMCCSCF